MTLGCGVDPCGTAGAGGYAAETLAIAASFPVGARTVRAVFTHDVRAWRSLRRGDACRPANWSVVSSASGLPYRTIRVELVKANVVDVTVDRNFDAFSTPHTVTVTGVSSCSYEAVVDPCSDTFNGMTIARRRTDADLHNYGVLDGEGNPGTFAHEPDSDIARHYGKDVIRKIVMRYVFAQRDSYKRLYPSFVGFMPALKTYISAADVVSMQAQLQAALSSRVSPDIRVTVSLNSAQNAVIVTVDGEVHTLVVEG